MNDVPSQRSSIIRDTNQVHEACASSAKAPPCGPDTNILYNLLS